MELKEYQLAASRTCPDLGSDKLNLSHMVMGMCSELSELSDAEEKQDWVNVAEEHADIMWYLANYANIQKLDLDEISKKGTEGDSTLAWFCCEITDLVKKYVAYNKPIDAEKEDYYIGCILHLVKFNLNGLSENGFSKALENNIAKLKVRYPEKFSDENAVNRNLEAERKELEK